MSVGRHLIFYLLMYFFSLLFLQQMFIPKSHKSACYLVFLLASVLGVEPLFTIYRAFTNDSVTQTDFVVVSLSPFWPQNFKCETFVTFWYLSQTSFHCLFFFHCVAVLSKRYFFFQEKNWKPFGTKNRKWNHLWGGGGDYACWHLKNIVRLFSSAWPKCHFVVHFKKCTFFLSFDKRDNPVWNVFS